MVAKVKSVQMDIKVPITIVERLPEPPCHWNTLVQSHGVVEKKKRATKTVRWQD